MSRAGAFFVSLCMVAIAGSLTLVCYIWLSMAPGSAAAVGLSSLLVMVLAHLGAERARDRAAIEAHLSDLTRTATELTRDIESLGQRIDRAERLASEHTAAATEPMAREIDQLGQIVHDFAQTLQAHEAALTRTPAPQPSPAPAPSVAHPPAPIVRPTPDPHRHTPHPTVQVTPLVHAPQLGGAFEGYTMVEAGAVVEAAVTAGRCDLYLQPIVGLPTRKVRGYHATLRLRSVEGTVITPDEWREPAERAGLSAALDGLAVERAALVAKRLAATKRDVTVVCGLSGASLSAAPFVSRFVGLLSANRALASSLMFAIAQADWRAFSAIEIETTRAAAELGFRFSLDHLDDLMIEPRDLSDRGVRQVRVDAGLLLDTERAGTSVHPADLSGLFARHAIDLVADGLDSESKVVEVLDYDIRFGQGALFSQPRPVRADVLAEAEPIAEPARMAAAKTPATAPLPAGTLAAAALSQGALSSPTRRPDRGTASVGQGIRALIRGRTGT